jgi:hypothetical protein
LDGLGRPSALIQAWPAAGVEGAFSLSTASQIYSQSASEKDAKEKEKKKSRKSEAN